MSSLSPLADRFRPQSLDDIVGQDSILSENSIIRHTIKNGKAISILLWGPPGSGKTTLARLYAKAFNYHFISLSAVFSGVADIKKVIHDSQASPLFQKKTILFVDEIHRFNKAQQDAFLPFIEDGTIVLIGATTENPSFSLNNALLSRLRVLVLQALDDDSLNKILNRYESTFKKLPLDDESRQALIKAAHGDGRYLLNIIESLADIASDKIISNDQFQMLLHKRAALYDKNGEGHYNLISALHKSVRGSDPDASLYWFCRMLKGGEDPLFLARRLIRMAVEDIGLADPEALKLAISARDAYQMLGSPEGELALAQVVVYLALAPKSNGIYTAYKAACKDAEQTLQHAPPSIILNAPTKLMSDLGYGKNYKYDHDEDDCFSGQNYFPDGLKRKSYYQPVERGFEREMQKRLTYFANLRKQREQN